MSKTALQTEAAKVARSVPRKPPEKRRKFADAKSFDLERAYEMVLGLIERCQLVGDVKAENSATMTLLKLMGLMCDRLRIEEGPDIAGAMLEAAARRAPLRRDFETPIDLVEDAEGVFS